MNEEYQSILVMVHKDDTITGKCYKDITESVIDYAHHLSDTDLQNIYLTDITGSCIGGLDKAEFALVRTTSTGNQLLNIMQFTDCMDELSRISKDFELAMASGSSRYYVKGEVIIMKEAKVIAGWEANVGRL